MISKKLKYSQLITLILIALLYSFVGVRYFHFEKEVWAHENPDQNAAVYGPAESLTTIGMLTIPEKAPGLEHMSFGEDLRTRGKIQGSVFFALLLLALIPALLVKSKKSLIWLGLGMLGILLWTFWALTDWLDPFWRLNSVVDQKAQRAVYELWGEMYNRGESIGREAFGSSSRSRGIGIELIQGVVLSCWLSLLIAIDFFQFYKTRKAKFSTSDILDAPNY